MILGSHVILSAYGFWLPNDPRGSWSDFVGAWELALFGKATKVDTRSSVAHRPHNRAAGRAAKRALKYPPVHFSGLQARAIGRGIGRFVSKNDVTVWACSILPEHIHVLLGRHRYDAGQIATLLKGEATRHLNEENLHPFGRIITRTGRHPKPFARGEWKVFLNTVDDVRRAIRYVEENPTHEGLPRQKWSFVHPFEGQSIR